VCTLEFNPKRPSTMIWTAEYGYFEDQSIPTPHTKTH
jgi:hypothetical protein